jgi:hypothetical protein
MYHRLFRASDFPVCAPLVEPGFQVSAGLKAALPSLWQRLFLAGQLHGGVVVDPEVSGPESIAAFSMCVFVDEAFIADYLRAPTPYPAGLVYERILAGRSPVLTTKALPAANSSGNMNLLILHFRTRNPLLDNDRARAVVAAFQSSFLLFFAGYRMRRVLQEAYGAEQLPFFTAGGFLMKSDYGSYLQQEGVQPAPDEQRPYLMGVYRDDPHTRYLGAQLSYLFQYVEPRFHFSAAEQRVLLRALMDESDETISDALAISHDAVKKTWRRIHDRVVNVAATVPELSDDVGDLDTTRGKERRRRLLQYVRHHLEELRPVARQPKTADPRSRSIQAVVRCISS